MEQQTREVYFCKHCRKHYLRLTSCLNHEPKCRKNPDNIRKCGSCQSIEMIEVEYHFDTFQGFDSRNVSVLYCKERDCYIYPLSVEFSDNGAYELGDKENNPMPKECEHFKIHGI